MIVEPNTKYIVTCDYSGTEVEVTDLAELFGEAVPEDKRWQQNTDADGKIVHISPEVWAQMKRTLKPKAQ